MTISSAYPAILAVLAAAAGICPTHAWQGSFPRIDLTCPVVSATQEVVVGGTVEHPEWTNDHYNFPCAHVAIPAGVARQPFPLLGGALQLDFTAPDPAEHVNDTTNWIVDFYLGQFGGDDTLADNSWACVDTYAWNSTEWQLGTFTSAEPGTPLNVSYQLEQNEMLKLQPGMGGPGVGPDLEGLEATIGVLAMKFVGPNGDDPGDQMAQCAYIRFTSNINYTPYCNSSTIADSNADSTGSGTGGPLTSGTAGAAASGTASPGNGSSHAVSIGVGVGVTCSAAALILAAGLLLIRRRRSRAAEAEALPLPEDKKDKMFIDKAPGKNAIAAMGLVEVTEKKGEDGKESGVGKDVDGSSVASGADAASLRSEQLPSYSQAVGEPGKQ